MPLLASAIRHSVAAVIRSPILIVIALLAGCSSGDNTDPPERHGFGANGRRDLAGLNVNTDGAKGGEVYPLYDGKRDHSGTGRAFADYGCANDDCADIERGYLNAKHDGIADMKLCRGDTWGELEGCVAFTQGLAPQMTRLPPATTEHP